MMNFTVRELTRLLAAMKSIGDQEDKALIERLEYRLSILKVEESRKDGASS